MASFISPPTTIPLLLRAGIWVSEKITGKIMLPARLLSWYPKAAVGSAVLEGLVAHRDGRLDKRILKIVRLAASFTAACPFCIDMNSTGCREAGVLQAEVVALQDQADLEAVSTLSQHEKLAARYARMISSTPLRFPPEFIDEVTAHFTEREMVVLATTAAQVNYWARLIQALGIPPAGFSDGCSTRSHSADTEG